MMFLAMTPNFSDSDLLALIKDLESDRVEKKATFSGDTPNRALEAVCAFANDLPGHNQPGVLLIGVTDNGEPSGCDITDELLQSLADMRSDGKILPLPVLTVEKRKLNNADVAVVLVLPSDMPPVKYRGRIWIRTGPRRAVANEQEERILNEKRRHKNIPFDIHPIPGASLDDLSRVIFENEYLPAAFADDVLEANDRTYEERLASCKMIVSTDEPTPTVLGLLTLGKHARDYLPGNYIQFLRIDGKELMDDIADEEKISGAMADMLGRAETKLQSHNRVAMDITSGPTHQTSSPYPMPALNQILYNAVLHRTYEGTHSPVRVHWFDDRIEITSPGGPYGNVTKQNFAMSGYTDYRNPNVADMLSSLGFVQAFGRGIDLAREAMDKNGNPPLQFEVNDSLVSCTLRAAT